MKKITGALLLLGALSARTQPTIGLDSIFSVIRRNHPALQAADAEVRSLDEAAKGAGGWEAPTVGTGWWMTPYDPSLWKRQANGTPGMGQYMISGEQFFPNRKSQQAEAKYMGALSSVEREKRGATLNELYAAAGRAYFQWMIAIRRQTVLDEDARLLDFMIRDAELKYKNNLGKIGSYYKAKAALGNLDNRRIALDNVIEQQRIGLNTLMNRNQAAVFYIDTAYQVMNIGSMEVDSARLLEARSDIRAVRENIRVTGLQQEVERAKRKPEFGVEYQHMLGFGGTPMEYSLMATVRLPMLSWASRASKANVESLKWKEKSLEAQRDALVNEAAGAAYGLKWAIVAKQRQVAVLDERVLPALLRNFQSVELAYEQNTEELFAVYDAWESLDNTKMEYWDNVESLLLMQVELKRVLEIK